ncbi:MAG: hypothetical protein L3J59_12285 [Methylococcaceae bacterium]|nr:hypothetical protein [Methylococcaceae bacterium]
MKVKNNIVKFLLLVLLLGIAPLSWAGDSLEQLYSLREIDKLENLIEKEQLTADTLEEKKRLGIAWHNLAIAKQSGAAEKAVEILEPLKKSLPKDYVVLAYLGSSMLMVGRDSWNPLTKMSSVNKGIALVDKAIVKDKDMVINRLIRVYNSLSLPGFFKRENKIKPDLDYLIDLIQRKETPLAIKSEINYLMGEFLINENERTQSTVFLEQAIRIDPKGTWAKKAQELIND